MSEEHVNAEGRFIRTLIESSHAIAKSKGWHEDGVYDTPARVNDRVLTLIALAHSEVVEAALENPEHCSHIDDTDIPHDLHVITDMLSVDKLEEYARVNQLTDKPEGYHYELADVVIRMADLWGWVGGEVPANIHPAAVHIGPWGRLSEPPFNCYTRDESLSNVHIALAVITEAVRVKNARPFHERVDLRHVIRACVSAASVQDYLHAGAHRLLKAIVVKMAFNTTRPYKHGKVA
jgi:hypothetical protein